MKAWENRAVALLDKSLNNIPSELNEIDWKSTLSDNNDKLAKHISAFSNLNGGGFLVFGIDNKGNFIDELTKSQVDDIVRKLGNIANSNLAISVSIDHVVTNYKDNNLLIIHIPESPHKPVCLKGNDMYECYKRSVGQTVKMAAPEVKALVATSSNIYFEEQIALTDVQSEDVLNLLNTDAYFRLLERKIPDTIQSVLDTIQSEDLIKTNTFETYKITNLGAILFADDITKFKYLKRKSVRLIIYKGANKIEAP